MKKKINILSILLTIITLGLFTLWSKNYLTALRHFKSNSPERHRLAFAYLKEICGSITIDFFDLVMEECGDEAVGVIEQIYRRRGFHYALVDNGNLPEDESQLRRGLTASLAGKLSTIDIRIHEYGGYSLCRVSG